MSYAVYKHTSPNGKVYIGITSYRNPADRWHNGLGYSHNKHFTHSIKKYGWDNFTHEILYTGLTKHQAEQKEIKLIAEYQSIDRDKGYNLSLGGDSKGKHSEYSKQLMSKIKKARYTSEQRKSVADANRKRVWTQSARKEFSLKYTGEKNPMYGVSRFRGDNPNSKKVICDGIIFDCGKSCANHYGIKYRTFMTWLQGTRKMPNEFKLKGLSIYEEPSL